MSAFGFQHTFIPVQAPSSGQPPMMETTGLVQTALAETTGFAQVQTPESAFGNHRPPSLPQKSQTGGRGGRGGIPRGQRRSDQHPGRPNRGVVKNANPRNNVQFSLRRSNTPDEGELSDNDNRSRRSFIRSPSPNRAHDNGRHFDDRRSYSHGGRRSHSRSQSPRLTYNPPPYSPRQNTSYRPYNQYQIHPSYQEPHFRNRNDDVHPAFRTFPTYATLTERSVVVFNFPCGPRYNAIDDVEALLSILSCRSIPPHAFTAHRKITAASSRDQSPPLLCIAFDSVHYADIVLKSYFNYVSLFRHRPNYNNHMDTFRVSPEKTWEDRQIDSYNQSVINKQRAKGRDWRRRDGGQILIYARNGTVSARVNVRDLEDEAIRRRFEIYL